MIRNIRALASHLGISAEDRKDEEEAKRRIARYIYKYTDCGAWIQFVEGGVVIGSIVEGVDQSATPHALPFPFGAKDFDAAITEIEDECTEIWNATHGCEQCGPEVDGRIAVNPQCKNCGGNGVVI